jgi:SAM-dependent methyltransferase
LCSALDGGSLESQTILEIGAGDGAFVKKVIEAGAAQPSITVLEYSDHGKNTIRAKYPGVHVRDGEDMALLPHSHFSHVFLFQVLEHLGNLNSFLSQLHRILKPNGLAFISVPNPLQVEFNELNKLLLDMPPNHISRFTEGAIHPLSARAGLSLELLTDEGFSWKSQISGYLSSRYMRLGQSRLSFPSLIDHCLDGAVRRMAAGLFVLIFLPEALLKLSSLSPRGIGGSRLIVLRKRNNGLL